MDKIHLKGLNRPVLVVVGSAYSTPNIMVKQDLTEWGGGGIIKMSIGEVNHGDSRN